MPRYKSVYDEKTKSLKQEPLDVAAKEIELEDLVQQGKIGKEEYRKQKDAIEKAKKKDTEHDDLAAKRRTEKADADKAEYMKETNERNAQAVEDSARGAFEKLEHKKHQEALAKAIPKPTLVNMPDDKPIGKPVAGNIAASDEANRAPSSHETSDTSDYPRGTYKPAPGKEGK